MKPKKLEVGEVVQIFWFDAHGDSGWGSPPCGDDLEPVDCISVGGVVGTTPRAVTICQSYGLGHREGKDAVDNTICIPWVNIEQVIQL